jgi:hypothetical protein
MRAKTRNPCHITNLELLLDIPFPSISEIWDERDVRRIIQNFRIENQQLLQI